MTKKSKTAIVAALVLLAAGAVAAIEFYKFYYDRKMPNFTGTTELYIYPETSVDEALSMVLGSCGPKNVKSVGRSFSGVSSVKPGHYTVSASDPSVYVARMMSNGWQTPVNLTLSGTMRQKSVIAKKIGSQMLVDSATVAAALEDEALLSKLGFEKKDVFALFIPDTYQVYWTDPVETVLERQKAAYDAFWTPENVAKAKAQGLTRMEASVLASIVNGETNHEPEMPSIAGVYLNRLHVGMKLQADPTVAYCFDYQLTRVLNKHLQVDSPFNTYKYAGLPPAPICVPSKAALNAVLNPDKHGYIFFCASPDFNGTHRFAVTLAEHMRNARAFQQALNDRNKSR